MAFPGSITCLENNSIRLACDVAISLEVNGVGDRLGFIFDNKLFHVSVLVSGCAIEYRLSSVWICYVTGSWEY